MQASVGTHMYVYIHPHIYERTTVNRYIIKYDIMDVSTSIHCSMYKYVCKYVHTYVRMYFTCTRTHCAVKYHIFTGTQLHISIVCMLYVLCTHLYHGTFQVHSIALNI